MTLGQILEILFGLWLISEILLAIFGRARRRGDNRQDRKSYWVMWGVFLGGLGLAALIKNLGWGRMALDNTPIEVIAMVVFGLGLFLRWYSIISLGHLYTVEVAIRPGHSLVRKGPYRWLRHPCYTGLLLLLLSGGIAMANWVSLAVVTVSVIVGLLYRIQLEEKVLVESLGTEYLEYCKTVKRLIPGLY